VNGQIKNKQNRNEHDIDGAGTNEVSLIEYGDCAEGGGGKFLGYDIEGNPMYTLPRWQELLMYAAPAACAVLLVVAVWRWLK